MSWNKKDYYENANKLNWLMQYLLRKLYIYWSDSFPVSRDHYITSQGEKCPSLLRCQLTHSKKTPWKGERPERPGKSDRVGRHTDTRKSIEVWGILTSNTCLTTRITKKWSPLENFEETQREDHFKKQQQQQQQACQIVKPIETTTSRDYNSLPLQAGSFHHQPEKSSTSSDIGGCFQSIQS